MTFIGRTLSVLSPFLRSTTGNLIIQSPRVIATSYYRDFADFSTICSNPVHFTSDNVNLRRNAMLTSLSPKSSFCDNGVKRHTMHTKGDRELVEFLQDEIAAEKKNLGQPLPKQLGEFSVEAHEAELTLTRTFSDEKITVTLNVNHSVDPDSVATTSSGGEAPESADLQSRPNFEVDIKAGSRVLSFTCSFVLPTDEQGSSDLFGINEVTVFEGDWGEAVYCVAGDILDEMMYDLLMGMLEERGISNEFVSSLCNMCTDYEHNMYVGFLQSVQDFVKRK